VERIQRFHEDGRDVVNIGDESPHASKRDQPNCVLTIDVVPKHDRYRRREEECGADQKMRDRGAIGVLDGERRKIPGSERYSADVTDINESD